MYPCPLETVYSKQNSVFKELHGFLSPEIKNLASKSDVNVVLLHCICLGCFG